MKERARTPAVPALRWLLVAVAGVVVLLVAAALLTRALVGRSHVLGDGRDPATYRFALQPSLVPSSLIVASGMPRDGLRALVEPGSWTPTELLNAAAAQHGKLLLGRDRVLGLRLARETRAYPLRFLLWHEVVNDHLGGEPILVTYNPLCDAAVAFRRPIDQAGATFAVSGLLYNSDLLMYRKAASQGGEGLWSQLAMRAISGPEAGTSLEPLACTVTTWRAWSSANPGTTVLAADAKLAPRYSSDPYTNYLGSDELRFPVGPSWPTGRFPRKTPVVAVKLGERWLAIPLPVVAAHAGTDGVWRIRPGVLSLRLDGEARPPQVGVEVPAGASPPTAYAFAFAWYAFHEADTDWVLD
jgi:hypothetical protein